MIVILRVLVAHACPLCAVSRHPKAGHQALHSVGIRLWGVAAASPEEVRLLQRGGDPKLHTADGARACLPAFARDHTQRH
jgi:hypothetical protein